MKRLILIILILCTLPAGDISAAEAAASTKPYIVVLRDDIGSVEAVAHVHARALGFQPDLLYQFALKGYAADLSDAAVTSLMSNPLVAFIESDRMASLAQAQPPQFISNGVRRIDGDESSTQSGDGMGAVNLNVAVIDDGMDATHPDLNVVGTTNCLKNPKNKVRASGPDPSGWHGTMVGGFIAAIDNDIGAVGVAPGARLWAAKACDNREGFCYDSEVICGLDWVIGMRMDADPTNDIAVANLSVSGPTKKDTGSCPASKGDAYHAAFCRTLASGVSIVAATGNDSIDFQNEVPAAYDEILAVTAMADNDGQPGGLGGNLNCLPEAVDDTAAFFSNFATLPEDAAHTVAAPGACISSTFPGGQYAVSSGTSFSTPLVAGTVALCIWSGPCAGLTPQQITQKIVNDAAAYNSVHPEYGFSGDPLNNPDPNKYYGFLIRAGLY
jgi:subtilisin family serine protease